MFPFENNPARIEAVAAGIGRFDTGLPCARGHMGPRYCSTGQCVQCCGGPMQPRAKKSEKPRKHPHRTHKQNQKRNQREAALRRREFGDSATAKKLARMNIPGIMNSAESQQRSRYLDDLIKKHTLGGRPL
jgi:hypothetical protein